ncbi:pilus assembly protein [Rhizobiaceae bacterium BDR2-2]|uniref:Pilus assembly protein n=1 Tax=Ectorhizobium quercum TaxID=2965071 RepID=A0AAE3MWH8_9HYPH|nr:TadE/TadG family type IV pilus assembly protein [Ectorhizobium quercum]MCX8995681.1 pilus assembly protein [Ectorhizobium quercum]
MGAVEFAMIAPLLLMLYLTAFEVTVGLSVTKRTARAASAIADLTTQVNAVDKATLETMGDVASAIFAPYSTENLAIEITALKIDSTRKALVDWSWAQDGHAAHTTGTEYDLPSDIAVPDSFLVHVRVSIPHQILMFMPSLVPASVKNITISREYFFRQRVDSSVACSDCPTS